MRPTGSIRQRSKGCFQIRYSLGIDPLTGKRDRIEIAHQGTCESAKKELRRLLKSVDDNQHVEPSKIKVGEFLTQWLATIKSRVSPKTYERYDSLANHFIIPTLGACLLSKLDPSSIQQAYNKWETTGRRDKKAGGLAPRTRLHIHRVFKLALKHAARMRLIHRNPADDVMPPRARKATMATLTVEQSAILLDAIHETRLYWPVLLALATGMRRGEILALRWNNVDFENKTVRVVESLEQTKQGVRFKAPKTERTRAVLLPGCIVEELQRLKEEQGRELQELGIEQTAVTVVCSGCDGKEQWPTTITHQFGKAVRKLPSLPKVRFHDLRHSHATQLLMAGVHPKIAQERLGHASITTTLDLYSHVTDTMQNDAVEKLDFAFRSAIKGKPSLTPKLG
jgi:integrase